MSTNMPMFPSVVLEMINKIFLINKPYFFNIETSSSMTSVKQGE